MRNILIRGINKTAKVITDCYDQWKYNIQVKTGSVIVTDIISPEEAGEKVVVFKPATTETFKYPKVYQFINDASLEIEYPEISLWKYNNAVIFNDSDFVITEDGRAVWPKYFYYNYAKNIIVDKNFVKEEQGKISYLRPQKPIEVDTAFSLIGVFSHIWAHVIVEYYPKLAVLKDAIADSPKKITVLVPEIKDPQTHQIVYEQLEKYDVDILVVPHRACVKAKTLYFMERPTRFTDHEEFLNPGDMAVPKATVDYLRSTLVLPYIKDIQKDLKYSKVFLPRRGGLGKGLINTKEIENYFKQKGYYFVEPHKLPFEEKVKLFYSADTIVGPLGSAFTNLMFCRPGTKVMMFSNYQRIFENYISMQIQYSKADIMYITGMDDKRASNLSHCSFYLPLEKVIQAGKVHGIIE